MAWSDLTAEIEAEFNALNPYDDALYDRLSGMLARIRAYKAQWQRAKWLAHREPASVTRKRKPKRLVVRSNGTEWRG